MSVQTFITVLRGTDTIGGSCIKISHGQHSIVLDYGAPIMDSAGQALDGGELASPSIENGVLLDIQGNDSQPPLAYLLSHAHPDHYGLMHTLPAGARVLLSQSSKSMMSIANIFYPESLRFHRLDECETFKPGEAMVIGPFTITAFMVDHSAFGACSILVEVAGKRVFYTGDFRGHGRKAKVTDYLQARVQSPDVMLMEGTTLDERHDERFASELSVEQAMVEVFAQSDRPALVIASGSNIDRLVSIYNAAKRAGKTLIIDLYQFYLLKELKRYAPGLPPHQGDHLRVHFPRSQLTAIQKLMGDDFLKYSDRHINLSKLQGHDYVVRLSLFEGARYLKYFADNGLQPQLIYSMWQGYQESQPLFAQVAETYGQEWQYMHTSGHAYSGFLEAFAQRINARHLIPVHTLCGAKFLDKFSNVRLLKNGEQMTI